MIKPTLKIYITENCPGCDEARSVAAKVKREHPDFLVELIDIANDQAVVPDVIFATPTFVLNNRIVSLGNPSPEQVAQWVYEATAIESGY